MLPTKGCSSNELRPFFVSKLNLNSGTLTEDRKMKVDMKKKTIVTLEDEVFVIKGKTTALIVPAGFESDLASIGLLRFIAPLLYATLDNYGKRAAVLHDYLYSANVGYTRKESDEFYYQELRNEGIARWRAGIFYYGVRLFGRSSFKKVKL